MARRKIHETKLGSCAVTIYRDSEWNEFVVQTRVGKRVAGGRASGGYFTDDKRDARSTAAAEIRRLRKTGVCRR